MRRLIQLLFFITLTFAINSCKKQDATSNDIVVPYETGKTITTVVAGKVTDQTGAALNNVQITIGSTTVATDVNGSFIIPKATLGEKVGFIKATKDGYFAGSRTIMPKEKVINNIVIQLVKKTQSGSFTNASGGKITVATGGSIVFPANSITLKSGGAYTGTVKVSAYFLDPTSKDCFKEMPGDLRGINTSNNEQVLTSYGMMAVELQGSNGEALQLATGKTATVTFPIVAATQSKAPATIPLWFFDETKGMWVEQGTATKTGNNYVATVSHFTWWNCDWGGGPITLTATFVDQNGNPLNDYHVYFVTSAGWGGGGGHGYTASDGSITGNIPANENIIVKVESNNYCGNGYTVLYTSNVGPFTQNTNLGNITVNTTTQAPTTINIKGTVVDCNNNPVTNGYATVHFNNNIYYTYIANGLFNLTNIYCTTVPSGTATVDVFDLTTLKQNTTSATVNVTGAGTFNVGQIAACGVQNFVHYTATFVDQNGAAITNDLYVEFDKDSTLQSSVQNGVLAATIRANRVYTRKIYVYDYCKNYILLDSTQIGPFTNDFNAGVINLTVPLLSRVVTIAGTVTDCSGNIVSNGFVQYTTSNGSYYTSNIINGVFSQSILFCYGDSIVYIIVTDNINHQQNTGLNASFDRTITYDNVGNVQACGVNSTELINYVAGGVVNNATDSLLAYRAGNTTYFTGKYFLSGSLYSKLECDFNSVSLGTYNTNVSFTNSKATYIASLTSQQKVLVNVTEYGTVGQYIAGTFNGKVTNQNSMVDSIPISGSFRIKRTQ